MRRRRRRTALGAAGAVLAAGALAIGGCGSSGSDDNATNASAGAGSNGGGSVKIALLLPESKTTRYETQDRPDFTQKVKELAPDATVLYQNADQDAAKQQQQAEAALTQGADVLVLDPVDGKAAAAIAQQAKQRNVPVISYDRLIQNAPVDLYISFDNVRVGKLQGTALADALGGKGTIVMINGSPTDPNAGQFKQGAHDALDPTQIDIAKEYDTADWSPDEAQKEAEQAITAVGKSNIDGMYVANDGMAAGVIAAMKSAGMDPTQIPVTGQDAQLDGIQRILAGEQYMTVYKAIKPEAETAAEAAVSLAKGQQLGVKVTDQVDNGAGKVPSVLLKPVKVTKDNVKSTVVADGFWKPSQICTAQYKQACAKAGIG